MAPITVVLELEWASRSRLSQTKAQVLKTFEALLTVVELTFETEDAVEQASLDSHDGNADFAECLHLALRAKEGHYRSTGSTKGHSSLGGEGVVVQLRKGLLRRHGANRSFRAATVGSRVVGPAQPGMS